MQQPLLLGELPGKKKAAKEGGGELLPRMLRAEEHSVHQKGNVPWQNQVDVDTACGTGRISLLINTCTAVDFVMLLKLLNLDKEYGACGLCSPDYNLNKRALLS